MDKPNTINAGIREAVYTATLLVLLPTISFSQKIVGLGVTHDTLLGNYELILDDPLTSESLAFGGAGKLSLQGRFTKRGWRAEDTGGFLKIELAQFALGEGALQVTMDGATWGDRESLFFNSAGDSAPMVSLISMFSSEDGNFLHEPEYSGNSCFWCLTNRFPMKESPPVNNFRLIWSSYGYMDASVNRYREKANLLPEAWEWDNNEYVFTIIWSKNDELLTVYVNGILFYKVDWYRQEKALRYIYLGKAGMYSSLQKVLFRDLKVFGK